MKETPEKDAVQGMLKCDVCKTLHAHIQHLTKREAYLREGLVEVRDEIALFVAEVPTGYALNKGQTKGLRKIRTLAEKVLDGKWEAPK